MREKAHFDPSPTAMNEPMLPMNYRTIWDTSAIEFDDIPTVQDVLRTCDKTLLLNEIMRTERSRFCAGHKGKPSKKQEEYARKRLRKVLGKMCDLKVKVSKKWCIFPELSFDISPSNGREYDSAADIAISCSIEPCLIRRVDLYHAANELEKSRPYLGRDDFRADAERRAGDRMPRSTLETYAIEFVPQKKTLGYRIWMAGTLSERERYQFLAAVFDDMTFLGYEPKTQKKRLARETKTLKKAFADEDSESFAYPSEIVWAGHAHGLPDIASAADFGLAAGDDENTRVQALGAFRTIREKSKKNFPKGMSLEDINAEIGSARLAEGHRRAMEDTIAAFNHNARLELLGRVVALDSMLQRGYRVHHSLRADENADGLTALLLALYAKEKLTFDDLPTLRDLLAAADRERLVARIHNDSRGEQFTPEQANAILDEMLSLPCGNHDSRTMLIACESNAADETGAACIDFSQAQDALLAARDAELSGGDISLFKQLRYRDGQRMNVVSAEASNRNAKDGNERPDGFRLDPTFDLGHLDAFKPCCIGLNPWAIELARKAWIDARFNDADRYSFLASTFFAFTEHWTSEAERIAKVEARQAKAQENGHKIGEPLSEGAWERITCSYGTEDAAAARELVRLLDHMSESFQ